ncbi:MAG TPA: UvrD-helicase domain-containing protein, partial [Candidatus Edwardsbacteria bacterium]|nr:UvrD-helicase domain-containing protein [Candidatus Edwardsbacteria bacterium]
MPAIRGENFPQLLLIEASAGSGKTYKLAGRFVEYLLSQRVPHNQLPNLLAVTFTNNAAREMKGRILSWLKNLALDADPDQMRQTSEALAIPPPEIKKLASDMVDQVIGRYSDFQVQTIDSFTNRLAQASARELGFRPDFKITTGYDSLLDEAIALLFRRIGPGRDAGLTAVMDRFLSLVNSGGTTYVWDPQSRMRETFVSFLKIEAKESGRFVFADTGAVIDRCLAEIMRVHAEINAIAAAHGLSRKPGKLAEYLEARNVERVLDREPFKGSPLAKGKAKGEQLAAHTASAALWEGLRPVMAELAVAWAVAGMAPYHLPYRHFKSELEQVKRRSGTHHIDDIASRLAGFLRQEMIPEIYLKLGSRLFHYMIDEFQDTDPAQWRSMQPLLDEALATQGSAFLVGDLKQAIYMFRKADYRIMKQLKQEVSGERPRDWLPASVAAHAGLENLEHNHRSGQVIVDYVAGVFQHNLKALIDQGRFGSDRTDLTSYRQLPWKTHLGQGFVSVRHFERPRDGDATAAAAGPVRQAVLEIIADARSRGYGHQDIAILADKNDQLERAIGWLTEAGIPASSSSGLDIRKRRVVAELLELLRWLDSPIDNLAWAATVSGEMLGRAARGDG